MSEIPTPADLARIGITQEEFDNRPVVAVGYFRGELLSPYSDAVLVQPRATSILDYFHAAREHVIVRTQKAIETMDIRRFLGRTPLIEVVGAYPDVCVPRAVEKITRLGFLVYVDPQRLLSADSGDSDSKLGAKVTSGGEYGNYRRVDNMRPNFYYNVAARMRRGLRTD